MWRVRTGAPLRQNGVAKSRRTPLIATLVLVAGLVVGVGSPVFSSDGPGPRTPGAAGAAGVSLFDPSARPIVEADPDPNPTEVGVRFRTDVAGVVTAIRFYKSGANTGLHIGHLRDASGRLLASGAFVDEMDSGWQQLDLADPVAVTPGTTYVASYHTDAGHYADDTGGLAAGISNGPLHALPDGAGGPNGVYTYQGQDAVPDQGWFQSNYWVDVVFVPTTPPVAPPVPSPVAPPVPAPAATTTAGVPSFAGLYPVPPAAPTATVPSATLPTFWFWPGLTSPGTAPATGSVSPSTLPTFSFPGPTTISGGTPAGPSSPPGSAAPSDPNPPPSQQRTGSVPASGTFQHNPWSVGALGGQAFFPIGIFKQRGGSAPDLKSVGINTYLGVDDQNYQAVTAAGLVAVDAAGPRASSGVQGTLLGADEPDGRWSGHPCVPASQLVAQYNAARDGSHPVALNLFKAVAQDDAASCAGFPTSPGAYQPPNGYLGACDICTFDDYPVANGQPVTVIGDGVDHILSWSSGTKAPWFGVECGRIGAGGRAPTPAQVNAEIWTGLIHGASGYYYFADSFVGGFTYDNCTTDPPMRAQMTATDARVESLASVLNTDTVTGDVTVQAPSRVDVMEKYQGGELYLLSVAPAGTTATFAMKEGLDGFVAVLGESRVIPVTAGRFTDSYGDNGVHLYEFFPA